jgi:hypothetical protein
MESMEALDGPFKGKLYRDVPVGTLRLVDQWYDEQFYIHKVTYLRTDKGWVMETEELIGSLHEQATRNDL